MDRAKSIFDSKKRKPVLFEDAVHFAIHLKELYDIDSRCHYSGYELFLTKSDSDTEPAYKLFKFSVERVDNDKGYEPGNIVLVGNVFNLMKNSTEKEDFTRLTIILLEHFFVNGSDTSKSLIKQFATNIVNVEEEGGKPLTFEEIEALSKDLKVD